MDAISPKSITVSASRLIGLNSGSSSVFESLTNGADSIPPSIRIGLIASKLEFLASPTDGLSPTTITLTSDSSSYLLHLILKQDGGRITNTPTLDWLQSQSLRTIYVLAMEASTPTYPSFHEAPTSTLVHGGLRTLVTMKPLDSFL